MKNTVKLFGLVALAALIGFAACDDKADPGNTDLITWSAETDGAASTANSTKITLTFSRAVSGLTADEITLTPLTVSADKGALSGSGKSYTLNITVKNQGYINVAVAKDGVTDTAQQVQVFKVAENPIIAGRKTYINDGEQVVFSAPTGSSGTYTLNDQKRTSNGNFDQDANKKWIWEPKAEGSYTWNQTAQTLTLTPEKVANDAGVMTAKADALPLFVAWIGEEIENEITERLKWSGQTDAEAGASVLAARNEQNGTTFTTFDELKNYLADIRFNETFTVRSYTYIFSNDGESLILFEELPEPVGTDELAGKTYNGTISDPTGPKRDPEHKYNFFATGRIYIEIGSDGSTISIGYYSYNSTTKQVYLKQTTKDGKTPEQFYDTTVYYEQFDSYPSEADNRTSGTYQNFRLIQHIYDPATTTINTNDTGEVEGL